MTTHNNIVTVKLQFNNDINCDSNNGSDIN